MKPKGMTTARIGGMEYTRFLIGCSQDYVRWLPYRQTCEACRACRVQLEAIRKPLTGMLFRSGSLFSGPSDNNVARNNLLLDTCRG